MSHEDGFPVVLFDARIGHQLRKAEGRPTGTIPNHAVHRTEQRPDLFVGLAIRCLGPVIQLLRQHVVQLQLFFFGLRVPLLLFFVPLDLVFVLLLFPCLTLSNQLGPVKLHRWLCCWGWFRSPAGRPQVQLHEVTVAVGRCALSRARGAAHGRSLGRGPAWASLRGQTQSLHADPPVEHWDKVLVGRHVYPNPSAKGSIGGRCLESQVVLAGWRERSPHHARCNAYRASQGHYVQRPVAVFLVILDLVADEDIVLAATQSCSHLRKRNVNARLLHLKCVLVILLLVQVIKQLSCPLFQRVETCGK
mmetsp:Transcript_623/g.1674  ORF Transcript_623/g.1674 Transcript_623/m.1674 type:complete len:305 (-) Transcript_623:14-928(-)